MTKYFPSITEESISPEAIRRDGKWLVPGRVLKVGEIVALPWKDEEWVIYACCIGPSDFFRALRLKTHGVCTNQGVLHHAELGGIFRLGWYRRIPLLFPTVTVRELDIPERCPVCYNPVGGGKYEIEKIVPPDLLGIVESELRHTSDVNEAKNYLPFYGAPSTFLSLPRKILAIEPDFLQNVPFYDATADAPPLPGQSDSEAVLVEFNFASTPLMDKQIIDAMGSKILQFTETSGTMRELTTEYQWIEEIEEVIRRATLEHKVDAESFIYFPLADGAYGVEKMVKQKPKAPKTKRQVGLPQPQWKNREDAEIVKPFVLGQRGEEFCLELHCCDYGILESALGLEPDTLDIPGSDLGELLGDIIEKENLAEGEFIDNSDSDACFFNFEYWEDAVRTGDYFLKLLKKPRKLKALFKEALPGVLEDLEQDDGGDD